MALLLTLTPAAKASGVVNAMQAKIENESRQFDRLVNVLKSNPALCYLAKMLETQHSESGVYINIWLRLTIYPHATYAHEAPNKQAECQVPFYSQKFFCAL